MATHFAEVIAGGSRHKNAARDYLLEHETELWKEFSASMMGSETGDWLWRKPADADRPQDLGYAIGARIVEAYLDNAPDRRRAVAQALAVTDYAAFLEASGYQKKITPPPPASEGRDSPAGR